MRVFVTGSASHLAQALLPRLAASPEISHVTGVDIAPTPFCHEKFQGIQLDVRDKRLPALLQTHDALVHLAFVVLRGKMDAAEMGAINIMASQQLFDAAKHAGIECAVHLSSASVYGSGENLHEDAAFRPLPGFLYAQHKALLENWLEAHHPQTVRLRPHLILGPHAQPLLKALIRQPFYIRLPDPQPRLQCVHEADVTEAILLALLSKARGAFNLAHPDTFSFKEIILKHHALALPVPLGLANRLLRTVWNWFGAGGEPAWLNGVDRTLTLDCSKAQGELGWMPKFAAMETIESAIDTQALKSLNARG